MKKHITTNKIMNNPQGSYDILVEDSDTHKIIGWVNLDIVENDATKKPELVVMSDSQKREEEECYSVKVSRPDGLSNAQWAEFCELMSGEDFEGGDFWGTVDSLFQEVMEATK
jgi:hypothetical protein